jgi:cytochrome P450
MDFRPRDAGFMAQAPATYRQLRAAGPVHHEPSSGITYILDHSLAMEVLRAPDRFSSAIDRASMRAGGLPPEVDEIRRQGWVLAPTLSHNDAPSHDVYRKLVAPFFLPRGLARLRPFILAHTDALVAGLPAGEPVEIVGRLAVPLPIRVVGELLGMNHLGEDHLKRWSDAFADELGFLTSTERAIEIARQTLACHRAMMDLAEARRGSGGADVISVLADAELDGRPLQPGEILSILTQLLVAGNETTTATLTFAILRLARDPRLLARLRDDRTKLPLFIEEVLRLDSPIQGQFRKALSDEQLGGHDIPAGSLLHVRFASANRDEKVWGPDTDEVRLDGRQPAAHLAFGMGLHFCVGAALSRAELEIALDALLDRFGDWRLADPEAPLSFRTHFHHRNLLRLDVEFRE